MDRTRITAPSYQETNDEPYLLSDFAIATGATCHGWKEKDDITAKSGYIWLRSAVETVSGMGARCRNYEGLGCNLHASYRDIGFLAHIQNPEASGFGIKDVNEKKYLTLNDALPLYPQAKADKNTEQELHDMLKSEKIKWVDNYTVSDAEPLNWEETKNKPLKEQRNNWCYQNGKFFAFVEKTKKRDDDSIFRDGTNCANGNSDGYFFECQPIEMVQKEDGSIQSKEILSICQLETEEKYNSLGLEDNEELDTNALALGNFAQNYFLKDLQRSVDISKQTNPTARKSPEQQKLHNLRKIKKLTTQINTVKYNLASLEQERENLIKNS